MQLEGATEVEKKVYQASILNEKRDAGEDQSAIAFALSDAGEALQRLRAENERMREALTRIRQWDRLDTPNDGGDGVYWKKFIDSVLSGSASNPWTALLPADTLGKCIPVPPESISPEQRAARNARGKELAKPLREAIALRGFVARIARMTKDGEELPDCDEPYDMSGDEAVDDLALLINEARELQKQYPEVSPSQES